MAVVVVPASQSCTRQLLQCEARHMLVLKYVDVQCLSVCVCTDSMHKVRAVVEAAC
jgi:hypothetical protein